MPSLPDNAQSIKRQALLDQAQAIVGIVECAHEQGTAAHEVEKQLFRKLLAMGYQALELLFSLYGPCDVGEQVEVSDGRTVKRLEELHRRDYLSIFGELSVERAVYGTRAGQKIDYVPLDVRLQLPKSKVSYVLQDWTQAMTSEMAYAQTRQTLERILGLRLSVNTLERTNRNVGASSEAYWDHQVEIRPAVGQQIVVCSSDGKGVVMRKTADEKAQSAVMAKPASLDSPPAKTQSGKKKMAVLGAVYTIEPHCRTPHEVLEALFSTSDQTGMDRSLPPRPKPMEKHVRASLHRDERDTLLPARQEIADWLGQEYQQRNRLNAQPGVLLMDGEDKLWTVGQAGLPSDVTQILDILHASSYVWQAIQALHPDLSTERYIPLVKPKIGALLEGGVKRVIRGFRWQATHQRLTGEALKKVTGACTYLENQAPRMRYDVYLAAGYPIASGVIEGACRHVVVDRMERSGMRWIMTGAQPMLALRCIHINGDWEHFMAFHIAQEQQAIHPVTAANDGEYFCPMVA
jgi:hypothetical protein